MRIWTLHPKYLDPRGLVALWREALLAQAVLRGKTNGYRHHPRLVRFRRYKSPVGAIAEYLRVVHAESVARGYRFSSVKISAARARGTIKVTRGQIKYEWDLLMSKLHTRDREWSIQLQTTKRPRHHPLFRVVPGGIEKWEGIAGVVQQGVQRLPASARALSGRAPRWQGNAIDKQLLKRNTGRVENE